MVFVLPGSRQSYRASFAYASPMSSKGKQEVPGILRGTTSVAASKPPLVLSKTKQSDSVDSCSGVRVTRFDTEAWERSLPSLDSRHSAIPLLSPACSTVGARLEVTVGSTEGVAVGARVGGGSSREPPQATVLIMDMITERATINFFDGEDIQGNPGCLSRSIAVFTINMTPPAVW